MIVDIIESMYVLQCDYCGTLINTSKRKFDNRAKATIDKDACKLCIKKKIIEGIESRFRQHVSSIWTDEIIEGKYKKIPISDDKFTLVDVDKYNFIINLCKWSLTPNGFVIGSVRQENGSLKLSYLHRIITGVPRHLEVTHINGDRLNNTKENLKIRSRQSNSDRVNSNSEKLSSFKGVTNNKDKWEVRIGHFGITYRIGLFTNELAAGNAYNFFSSYLFGEYAVLNDCEFMDESEWRSYNTGKQLHPESIRRR